jgi:hypothetical protein
MEQPPQKDEFKLYLHYVILVIAVYFSCGSTEILHSFKLILFCLKSGFNLSNFYF